MPKCKTIKGYKGFDSELKCRGYQYEIGGEYITAEKIAPCRHGFHFCSSISDVFAFYPNQQGNRFCEVEAFGDCIDIGDKTVTSKIRIVRELTQSQLFEISNEHVFKVIRDMQKKYQSMVLGGSFGLFLHGVKISRSYTPDVDFINPYFLGLSNHYSPSTGSGKDFVDAVYVSGGNYDDIKVEVATDPYVTFMIIKYKEKEYRVQPLKNIMAKKFEYYLRGAEKHKDDIISFMDHDRGIYLDLPF